MARSSFPVVVLGLLMSFGALTAAAHPFFFVLDFDRMWLKEKPDFSEPIEGRREYLRADGDILRVAAYAPEFLVALKFGLIAPRPTEIVGFSGARRSRNVGVVESYEAHRGLHGRDLFSQILSYDELTLIRDLPDGISREEAPDYFAQIGGQDEVPFFTIFSKDLRKVQGLVLPDAVIFEDNPDSVPKEQTRYALVIARPHVLDEDLAVPWTTTEETRKSKKGWREPVQIARSKYRLVRAIGLLDLAFHEVGEGHFPTVADALFFFQWGPDGRFRSRFVNQRPIYERGMAILRETYDRYLAPFSPSIPRSPEYFTFEPFTPRREDCEKLLTSRGAPLPTGIYPWDEIPGDAATP